MTTSSRDFSDISPTAKSLLLMKGYTDIPFAREAAELISLPGKYAPSLADKDIMFLIRMLHFENRYKSINQLMEGIPVKNILEVSSGFSFRGLHAVQDHDIHYIDTDLPEIIRAKKDLIHRFKNKKETQAGRLETLAMNALDAGQFAVVTGRFTGGPVVVVNEGLLMYLNDREKAELSSGILKLLRERGGYWITADIYLKMPQSFPAHKLGDSELEQIFQRNNVEQNKFDSFEAAEAFFNAQGLIIDKEADPGLNRPDYSDLIKEKMPPDFLNNPYSKFMIQKAWRLKPAGA